VLPPTDAIAVLDTLATADRTLSLSEAAGASGETVQGDPEAGRCWRVAVRLPVGAGPVDDPVRAQPPDQRPAALLAEHVPQSQRDRLERLLGEREALRCSDGVASSEQVPEDVERRLAVAVTKRRLLLR
jgi:hypothetical protein